MSARPEESSRTRRSRATRNTLLAITCTVAILVVIGVFRRPLARVVIVNFHLVPSLLVAALGILYAKKRVLATIVIAAAWLFGIIVAPQILANPPIWTIEDDASWLIATFRLGLPVTLLTLAGCVVAVAALHWVQRREQHR